MNTVMTRCILLFVLMLGAGCAAHNPQESGALLYAKALDMVAVEADFSEREIFTGMPCALLTQKGLLITAVNGDRSMKDYVLRDEETRYFWSEKEPLFLPPGKNTFTVQVASRINAPQTSLSHTFEEGKHYSLDYVLRPDTADFTFKEITDDAKLAELAEKAAKMRDQSLQKSEFVASFHEFAREHPKRLEGKWSMGHEKAQLEFSGNKVRYMAAKSMFIDTPDTLEGVFMYNKNSMLIQWNSLQTFANRVTREERPDFLDNLYIYYILSGDTLEIRHPFTLPFSINGTYTRVR